MSYYVFILKNGEYVHRHDERYKKLELKHQKARQKVAKALRKELQKTQFDNKDWKEYNKRLSTIIDFRRVSVYYGIDIIHYEDHDSIVYYRLTQSEDKSQFAGRLARKAIGQVDFKQIEKYRKIEKELEKSNKNPQEKIERLKQFGFIVESCVLNNTAYYTLIDCFLNNQKKL